MVDVSELRKFKSFGELTEDQLAELAEACDKRQYEKQSFVYRKGDRATQMFGLSKGLVSLRDIQPGDLVGISYEICEPGQLFGGSALVWSEMHSLAALCLEDSEVVAIEGNKMLAFCKRDPEFGYNLMLTVARRYFNRYQQAKQQLYSMVKEPAIVTALPT
jgi:signal-transduction protein with cAMP-binding, CBS, and nucleotidyltransferase domain